MGTGEYELPTRASSNQNRTSPMKVILIWVGFIAGIPILVYAIFFLERLGLAVSEIIYSLLCGVSWAIIFVLVKAYSSNSRKPKNKRLPSLDPNATLVSKILTLCILLPITVQIIAMALYPLIKLIKYLCS
jgi:hypothetical protein